MRLRKTIFVALIFTVLLATTPVQSVQADTWTVIDCSAPSGTPDRLVDIIIASSSGDTINFACSGTISLTSTLVISKNLTIDGMGQTVAIRGAFGIRVISITSGSIVSLNSLTIQNGIVDNGGGGIHNLGKLTVTKSTFNDNITYDLSKGGAIYNRGILEITESSFSNNTSQIGGGGIYNGYGGTLTITDTIFSGNIANGSGGAIDNDGTLIIKDTTISGNYAGTEGGGIRNSRDLTVTSSTFSDNSAGGADIYAYGGAIYNAGSASVSNSTFSANSAKTKDPIIAISKGGGIFNSGFGILSISYCTFSANRVFSGLLPYHWGSGIYNDEGVLHLKNSILADSVDGEDCYNDSGDVIATNTDNLIEVNGEVGHRCGTPRFNSDPALDILANNGGLTKTHALLPGSPAIDAIPSGTGGCNSTYPSDQRGVARPQGANCDIGAYEKDTTTPTVTANSLQVTYTGNGPSAFTLIFSEALNITGDDTGADSAINMANYLLLEEGQQSGFQSTACDTIDPVNDTRITLKNIDYDDKIFSATVKLDGVLPIGNYRLFVCGTTSIVDLALNPLNDGTDYTFDFNVRAIGVTEEETKYLPDEIIEEAMRLPDTGFPMGGIAKVPEQPIAKAYTATEMRLEIPILDESILIVGVPITNGEWDVTWLGNNAGHLAGSAFPTWAGNTVLTGHVWNAWDQSGPFAELKSIQYGDLFYIHAWDQSYTYEVRENRLLWATGSTSWVFKHEELDWVTLLTCESYSKDLETYRFRRVVRAVLVDVSFD